VFEGIKPYADRFPNQGLWLCVNDTLLNEEEFSDILEESSRHRTGYSSRMDLILNRVENQWQGMMDFPTKTLLPRLPEILAAHGSLVFFPLHVQDQTLGYVALTVDDDMLDIGKYYHFLMNISTALEITRSHLRQLTIIQNLENKYVHDPMTGLFNRRGFYQKVVKLFEQQQRENKLFSIISVDLNGLKPINDTYGHSDGDIAISTVGKALTSCTQKETVCARFGGDEYVVAGAPDTEEEAEEYIQRVRDYLKHFNETGGKPYEISASFGLVTAVPSEAVTLDEFIRQADEKMYTEKATHHLSRGR
jgi:diguanylate cyclase (GGDEF)-like protein